MPLFKDTRPKEKKRFEIDKPLIYGLFDAFVEASLVNNSTIDFSTPVSLGANNF